MNILVLNGGSSSLKCALARRHKNGRGAAGDRRGRSSHRPRGRAYRTTTPLTADVREAIAKQCEFAPAHTRLELEAIQYVTRALGPSVRQVAVFDTAFHATLEP